MCYCGEFIFFSKCTMQRSPSSSILLRAGLKGVWIHHVMEPHPFLFGHDGFTRRFSKQSHLEEKPTRLLNPFRQSSTRIPLESPKGSSYQFRKSPPDSRITYLSRQSIYFLLCLLGAGMVGWVVYTLTVELILADSPYRMYTRLCRELEDDHRITELLGSPIKCFGEGSRRGHRRLLR